MRYCSTSSQELELHMHEDASFFNPLEQCLQELSRRHVAMESIERKKLVDCAEKVVKYLLNDSCKKHPNHFGKIYGGVQGVGSYYDRVRVKEATEFDFNVVLNLRCLDLVIDRSSEPDGFVKLRIDENKCSTRRSAAPNELQQVIKKWTNNKGYLISQKLKSYMESISHYWVNLDLNGLGIEVQPRIIKSGPAVTLLLNLPNAKEISIDLVPVIRMANAPPKAYRWGGRYTGDWYLVPKSYRYVNSNQDESWRLSFPLQERMLLSYGRMKHVLRLVKKVRDSLQFNSICSYHIKTLFLWKRFDEKLNWEKHSLSYLFFTMLTVLAQCLEHGRIQNFWCGANLLESVKSATSSNWASRLQAILHRLKISIAEKNYVVMREILSALLQDQLTVGGIVSNDAPASGWSCRIS